MLPMNNFQANERSRRAAERGLAVAGFIALVVAGMWLAVYSTRFVPIIVNRAGSAAVYLGSLFVQNHKPSNSVISTSASSTIIYFGGATSTVPAAATVKKVATTAGTKTSSVYQISGTATPSLSGLPDLVVYINAVGYLTSASTDSFVASSTVPSGSRPAVSFTIKNIGTNTSGQWRFSTSIPTQTAYIYQSPLQQSLLPGDSIDYILGFDQANKGTGETVSVTANFDRAAKESNTDNNSSSAKMTILGS